MERYFPLFPLDIVLFPDMLLPLHIFEERYKEMIGECLNQKSSFGILYTHEETTEEIGCTAEIIKVMKHYPDGRLDILVMGRERFRVLFLDSERAYLRGNVESFSDNPPDAAASKEKAIRAVDLYQKAYRLLNRSEPEELNLGSSYAGVAFKIACVLYLNNELKQEILVARSEDERLEVLSEHLEEIIPKLREAEKSARQAGSNGNLRHA